MKKTLILFLFICFTNLVYSQSFGELNQKAVDLYKQGKLSECIALGEKALEQCKKENSDTSFNYYLAVSNLATYYYDNGNYIDALKCYKPTVELRNKFYGADDSYFRFFNENATCWQKIGDKKTAEKIYNYLLVISKSFYGDSSKYYNNALGNLAYYYFNIGDYQKAKPFYIEIRDRALKYGYNSVGYATAVNNLGLLYYNLKQFDSSSSLYKSAIEIFDKNSNKISQIDYVTMLHNLALSYDKSNIYLEAKKYYKKEIELRQKLNILDGSTNVITLLAWMDLRSRDYEEAIDYYKKEVEIKNKSFIADSFDFLTTNENLLFAYEKIGDKKNALSTELFVLTLKKNIYGELSLEYLNELSILAIKNHVSGNYSEALNLFNKALIIREQYDLRSDSGYYYLIKNLAFCFSELKDSANSIKYKSPLNSFNQYSTFKLNENDSLRLYSFTELYKIADSIYGQKKYIESIKYAKVALEIAKTNSQKDTSALFKALTLLGNIEFAIGNYSEAEKLFQEENNLAKYYYTKISNYYITTLLLLEILYEERKDFSKARSLCIEHLSIQKFVYGEGHVEYADACNKYAKLLIKTFEFEESNKYFNKAEEIYKTTSGVNSEKYVCFLLDLADLYMQRNDFKTVIKCYDDALKIVKLIGKENSENVIDIYEYLTDVYQRIADYKTAEKYINITNELSKKYYGKNSVEYITFLLSFADFYLKNGNYKLAEKAYLNCIASIQINFGKKSPEYIRVLNNLGLLYQQIGQVNQSDSLINLSNSIIKYIYGDLSEEYALCINNKGLNRYQLGDYNNAEKFFLEAASIRKKILGESNSDYAASILNLGNVYFSIGNYNSAEIVTKEAKIIFNKNNSQEMYATALNNLGLIYFLQENYENAEIEFKDAIEVKRKTIGENHPDYIKSLYALGMLYLNKQEYSIAEKYILESVSLSKKIYGEKNSNYAIALNLLALLYNQTGRLTEAEDIFLKTHAIFINTLGEKNLISSIPVSGLNMIYEKRHEIKKADSLLIKISGIYKDMMIRNFEFMSMSQTLDFIKSQERNFSYAYSYLSRNSNSDAVSSLFDMDLFIRNTTLYNSDKLELIANKNNDTSFLKKWATYKFYKSTLSKSKPQDNTAEIEKKSEELEKQIMSELPEYSEAIKNNNINWRVIQNKLKPTDAVISYVSFRYNSNIKLTDSVLYAAFVIRKDWKQPKYIPVCNESQLAEIFEINNNGESIDKLYTDISNGLYNTIWKPLDSLFIGVNRIYLSPISMLNRVSFSAILSPNGSKLIDKYNIQILANVRSIAEISKNPPQLKSAFLFGDIDYNNEPVSVENNFTYKITDSTSLSSMRSVTNGKWGNLNSTGYEVSTIQRITTSSKINTMMYLKQSASEESFKKIKSPSILHIATHGFSSPQPKQNNNAGYSLLEDQKNLFKKSIDPLTRSGLVMAGGNQMWQKGVPYTNHEDEILTAKEVSDMDLSGCILTTLSACETGLGDVKGSEGVFGLQRAFKMAGVHYLIVSLWKVPDTETADFMQTFYYKWLVDKNEIKDAFRKTQLEMSNKYKQPFKWAGFVLVE